MGSDVTKSGSMGIRVSRGGGGGGRSGRPGRLLSMESGAIVLDGVEEPTNPEVESSSSDSELGPFRNEVLRPPKDDTSVLLNGRTHTTMMMVEFAAI